MQRGLPADANRGSKRYTGPRGAEDQEINIKDVELGTFARSELDAMQVSQLMRLTTDTGRTQTCGAIKTLQWKSRSKRSMSKMKK